MAGTTDGRLPAAAASPARGPAGGWQGACVRLACLVALAAGGGCSLILDFSEIEPKDGGGGNVDGVVAADGSALDAAADPFEPNDSFGAAQPIQPGTHEGLKIDPKTDRDFFSFSLIAASDVTIDCLFTQVDGDLDLMLYDSGARTVGASTGYVDNEHIVKTAAQGGQIGPGDFVIEVHSFQQMYTNTYTLVLTVQ